MWVAISIAAFQLGLPQIFEPLLSGDKLLWPVVYYGAWCVGLALTAAMVIVDAKLRSKALPVLLICGLSAAMVLFHPLDSVAKNYLVAMALVASIVVLALGSVPLALLRYSAAATFLGAIICLLDVMFSDGFTTTSGRAAGLWINPNIAAGGLLLGATATYQSVSRRLQLSFALVISAAMLVTLSRSMLLASLAVGLLAVLITAVSSFRSHRKVLPSGRQLAGAAFVGLALLLWISAAFVVNDRFRASVLGTYTGLQTAAAALEKAFGVVDDDDALAVQVQALSTAAKGEGVVDSASARGLLMVRAWLTYLSGPPTGSGLAAAHGLVPHNSFLLFANAFGHLGWLVPLGFLGLVLYHVKRAHMLPLAIALFAVIMTSHDALLIPALIVPIALGFVSLIAARSMAKLETPSLSFSIVTVGAAVLFAFGGVAVSRSVGSYQAALDQSTGAIAPSTGRAYVTFLPPPPSAGVLRITNDAKSAEVAVLAENEVPLKRAATAEEAGSLGQGRYYIASRTMLVFSSSDNSDPRSNGRSYKISAPISMHPLFYLTLAAMLVWCALAFRFFGRARWAKVLA